MTCHENCHLSARVSPFAEDKYSNLLNKKSYIKKKTSEIKIYCKLYLGAFENNFIMLSLNFFCLFEQEVELEWSEAKLLVNSFFYTKIITCSDTFLQS